MFLFCTDTMRAIYTIPCDTSKASAHPAMACFCLGDLEPLVFSGELAPPHDLDPSSGRPSSGCRRVWPTGWAIPLLDSTAASAWHPLKPKEPRAARDVRMWQSSTASRRLTALRRPTPQPLPGPNLGCLAGSIAARVAWMVPKYPSEGREETAARPGATEARRSARGGWDQRSRLCHATCSGERPSGRRSARRGSGADRKGRGRGDGSFLGRPVWRAHAGVPPSGVSSSRGSSRFAGSALEAGRGGLGTRTGPVRRRATVLPLARLRLDGRRRNSPAVDRIHGRSGPLSRALDPARAH